MLLVGLGKDELWPPCEKCAPVSRRGRIDANRTCHAPTPGEKPSSDARVFSLRTALRAINRHEKGPALLGAGPVIQKGSPRGAPMRQSTPSLAQVIAPDEPCRAAHPPNSTSCDFNHGVRCKPGAGFLAGG
jgi:hypothetical protein